MTLPSKRKRRDELGRAFLGSQLQVQIYVNRRAQDLNAGILKALGADAPQGRVFDWRSPLEKDHFAEYMDGKFLVSLDLPHLATALRRFWPRSGPRWDGLAILRANESQRPTGYLLIEGKSYPEEVYGSGCQARADSGPLNMINAALKATKNRLGVDADVDWTGRLYQYANRLAHAVFLQDQVGLPVWLVNLCFMDDPRSPVPRETWIQELSAIKKELGFANRRVPHSVDVLLPAQRRDEILTASS